MSKRDIDPGTGLPILGEDYRWVVSKEEVYDRTTYGSYKRETGNFQLSIQNLVTGQAQTKFRRFLPDKVVQQDPHWVTVLGMVQTLPAKTKTAVLAAAFQLAAQLNTYGEEQALLGTYPPKKL